MILFANKESRNAAQNPSKTGFGRKKLRLTYIVYHKIINAS